MALTDYADYLSKVAAAKNLVFLKNHASEAGVWGSSWRNSPDGGSAPGAAAAPNSSTLGSLFSNPRLPRFTNANYISGLELAASSSDTCSVLIADRLSHSSGLSGTTTTAQTTNLPTAALTRYTDGVGVFIGVEIHTDIGTTGTTFTCEYTNQAGTGGRTTKATTIGANAKNGAGHLTICPLQDGDTGVRSVQNFDLVASTTVAGDIGITLFKPLMMINYVSSNNVQNSYFDAIVGGGGLLAEIKDNACIFLLCTDNSQVLQGTMKIIEVA